MQGFAAGRFARYAESDKKKRKWANLARAMGVVEAMAIQKLKNLQRSQFAGLDDYLDGTHALPIVVASIDLLSDAPTLLKGDAVMVRDHHAALRSLDGRELTFTIRWTVRPGVAVKKKVTVVVTMLDFNLAVNQAATFVLSSARTSQQDLPGAAEKPDEEQAGAGSQASGATQNKVKPCKIRSARCKTTEAIPSEGLYQSHIEDLNESQAELRRLERTDLQIRRFGRESRGAPWANTARRR